MDADASAGTLTDRHLLRWMFGFLRPVRRLVLLACLYLTLATGVEILAVRQTALTINQIELVRVGPSESDGSFWAWLGGRGAEVAGLERAVLMLAVLSLTLAGLSYFREVANVRLTMHKVFFIREAIYDKLQRVGLRFHDRISTGELINRALSDLQHVRSFIQTAVLVALEIGLIAGGYIILLLTRSPWAALLALAPLPLWAWYAVRFSKKVRPARLAEMEVGDQNISLITENVAGVHVVKAFAAEPYEIEKYNRNCDELLRRVLTRIRLYANFIPVVRGISMTSHLALFLLAGILIIKGRLLPGDILMLGAAMGAILTRLQQVATINEQYQNAMVSARRLHEVLAAEPTVPPPASPRPMPPGHGAVRFEHVTFGYDPAQPVLHNVSFEVPGGQVVALVGPTAAGKTTLVQLLARLYDPQRGRILVDGVDVREIDLASLRQQIAFVFQETFLFSDSVEENIAYGRPEVRGDTLQTAARLADAHEFVTQLPRGYQTVLGERGTTLSGGQRQRLAIARALFARPRILILDDATAAVDPETEELIHGGVRSAMKGLTVFVIAHRLNTVQRADCVIVLESGRITQMGTHNELMQSDGHYRDIARVQLATEDEFDISGEPTSHLKRVQDFRKVSAARTAAEVVDAPPGEPEP